MKLFTKANEILRSKDGFGMSEIIGTAAVLIIAAFVLIPGLRGFSQLMIDSLTDWFEDVVTVQIFPSS